MKPFNERLEEANEKHIDDHNYSYLDSFNKGALWAREETVREIVEWLRSDEANTADKYENYPGCMFWAENIECKCLSKEIGE